MSQPTTPASMEDLLEHKAWVRSLAIRLLHDRHDAEDIVQETMRVAIERKPRSGRGLGSWLSKVTTHLASSHRRTEARRLTRERRAASQEVLPSASEAVERAELLHELARAVLALQEPYRSTIVLRFYEELGAAQIARIQGVQEGTVRVRIQRGIDKLRSILRERLGKKDLTLALLALAQEPNASIASTTNSWSSIGGILVGVSIKPWAVVSIAILLVSVFSVVASGWLPSKDDRSHEPAGDVAFAPTIEEVLSIEPGAGTRTPTGIEGSHTTPERETGFVFRAVDAEGKAVIGARVHLWIDRWGRFDDEPVSWVNEEPPSWLGEIRSRHTSTGEHGECRISGFPEEAKLVGLRVDLGGDDWALRSLSFRDLSSPGIQDLGEIVLEPGWTVSGVVRDPHGQPMEGVLLRMPTTRFEQVGDFTDDWAYWGRQAHTDASGQFELGGIPSGTHPILASNHHYAEHEVTRVELGPDPAATDLNLNLQPISTTTISFVDDLGRKMPGVQVELSSLTVGGDLSPGVYPFSTEHVADRHGVLEVLGLAEGATSKLQVRTEQHVELSTVITGGERRSIVLATRHSIRALVLDHEGNPTPGVKVHAFGSELRTPESAATNADGVATLNGLPAGAYTLAIGSLEEPLVQVQGIAAGHVENTPPVVLQPELRSRLTVTIDIEDSEVEVASVNIDRIGRDIPPGRQHRPSVRDRNRFVFENVPSGTWKVWASLRKQPNLRVESKIIEHRAGQEHEISLEVFEPGSLTVFARDPRGGPIPGLQLMLRKAGGSTAVPPGNPWETGYQESDTAGRVQWKYLVPGDYWVVPMHHGWRTWVKHYRGSEDSRIDEDFPDVELFHVLGGEESRQDMVLDELGGLKIVVTRSGQPVSNAEGEIYRADSIIPFRTDSLGRFTLYPIAAGEVLRVTIRGPQGGMPQIQEVEIRPPATSSLRFELSGAVVTGSVLLESDPLSDAMVWLVPEDREHLRPRRRWQGDASGQQIQGYTHSAYFRTNAAGRFRFEDIPAGKYRIEARHAGAAPMTAASILVQAQEERELGAIRMQPGGGLRVRVKPVGNTRSTRIVNLGRDGEAAVYAKYVLEGPRERLYLGLAPGLYQVRLTDGMRDVEVVAGQITEVEL